MSSNWTEYLDRPIEFTHPDMDDDRQVGTLKRIINDVLIVEVDGREIRIDASQVTGAGFD